MKLQFLIFGLFLLLSIGFGKSSIRSSHFLSLSGRDFTYDGEKVYLSGTNTAWISYGYDFGNNAWADHGDQWVAELDRVAEAGGNSVRVWVHVEGDSSPHWDWDGFTLGTDEAGTLVQDLTAFLDECQARGIFMGLVLFNGALMRNQNTINLFWDESKLQRYIDNALIPMVEGLRDHPALGFWEVMNEAEGSMIPGEQNSEPCFDLTHLDWTKEEGGSGGPGWTGVYLPLQGVLRLHNWIGAAIKTHDAKALVTTGSWNPLASTNIAGDDPVHKTGFNHYSAECLIKAGGREAGVMDFVQFHNYPWAGEWQLGGPWRGLTPDDYNVDGPLLVGEFPCRAFEQANGQDLPGNDGTEDLVEYLYTQGFAGGLSWAFIPTGSEGSPEVAEDVMNGIRQLQGRTEHGKIDVNIS